MLVTLTCIPCLFSAASAPPVVSQLITAANPLSDEFGQTLNGTDPGAGHFGHTAVLGDVVHIYLATDGVIYPPNALGQPDSRNTLLLSTRIGRGMSAQLSRPGMFSAHVTPRPGGGSKIFTRVFNAPTVEGSSFYMDSQLFSVSWAVNETFTAQFDAGIKELDTADDDDDGVSNSWEKSNQTDPHSPDSDNDGFTDLEEWIAGTDPTSQESAFIVSEMTLMPPHFIRLSWKSERNRQYTVEKKQGLGDDHDFETVDVVNGNGADFELLVPMDENPPVFYRVKVTRLPEPE